VLAAYATAPNPSDPLAALKVSERPEPDVPEGWTKMTVRAASINHHDLWTLKGVGLAPEHYPMILGTDASGIDEDGREVVVHSVIATPEWSGDETLDPRRTLLSELHPGTFAERVAVPLRNLVPKPAELSHVDAACLGTAWLTAYRMLFVKSGVRPGGTVLVQGASGGVATALVALGAATGYRVWVTGRSEPKRQGALELGADAAFEPGARLPARVDAVFETVGEATWSHSLKALEPGGTIVVSGATTGFNPPADLSRVYFRQLNIVGSTMGTRAELEALIRLLVTTGLRPVVDTTLPLRQAGDGLARIAAGDTAGKIVLTLD
jgi:NADPH:quinone reductase-like Zn-dependent oxidoreductase